jgi:hypothetical protein
MARRLHADPATTIRDICTALGVSRATLYRYLGDHGRKRPGGEIPRSDFPLPRTESGNESAIPRATSPVASAFPLLTRRTEVSGG